MVLLRFEDLAGLHEDALHHLPVVVLAGGGHAVHLFLPVDGPPILLARHREEDLGGGVLEAHLAVPRPVRPAANHCPVVQVVALAGLPKRAHLLRVKNSLFGAGVKRGGTPLSWTQRARRGGGRGKGWVLGIKWGTSVGLGLSWDLESLFGT